MFKKRKSTVSINGALLSDVIEKSDGQVYSEIIKYCVLQGLPTATTTTFSLLLADPEIDITQCRQQLA